jgi:colanic acid biosynthesis glycosyl transferase WcaI
MRVLLLNQFFWPDSAATSQLLTDVARDLARRGHEVHAICAATSYASESGEDEKDVPPVIVHRVKALGFVRGKVGRILSYGSFYAGAAWRSFRIPKPDVVLTLTTPPLLSLVGNLLKVLRGSRLWIWEMDLYPDVAVDLGYMNAGGLIQRVVGSLADWSRRRSDGVIALGECMKDRLVARGIPAGHIEVCDNWADASAIPFLEAVGSPDRLCLLYSGNLGLAHDLDTLTGAMKELEAFIEKEAIASVQMLPYAKRADLGRSLAMGDIGLVTQRDPCCGSVVPSKVYGLMAAGRPILFIGPAAATPARIIRQFECGWNIACGDVAGLTALLLRLADHRDQVRQAGARGRQALLDHFDLPLGTARIVSLLLGNFKDQPAAASPRPITTAADERGLISNS